MRSLKTELAMIAMIFTLLAIESCTSNRSYSRDYTVNRSARSSSGTAYSSNRNHNRRAVAKRTTPVTRSTDRESTQRRNSVAAELTERNHIIDFAQKFVGKPYRYGGKTPESGFDCSGLVYYTYRHFNYAVNASSGAQSQQGRKVKLKEASPGDLLFFGTKGRVSHVAFVAQNTGSKLIMLHASTSSGVIKEDYYKSAYWQKRFMFARSYVGSLSSGSMANR